MNRADYIDRIRTLLPGLLMFAVLFLLIRGLEVAVSSSLHPLPDQALLYYLKGVGTDLMLACLLMILLLLVALPVASRSKSAARRVLLFIAVLLLGAGAALSLYFSYGLYPLGADLFGYNFSEIRETLFTSLASFNLFWLIPVPALLLFGYLLYRMLQKPVWSGRFVSLLIPVLVAGALLYPFLSPSGQNYQTELGYHLTTNKLAHFSRSTARHTIQQTALRFSLDRAAAQIINETGSEYPLWREASAGDPLGPWLNTADQPPNLVFIIVEGLGGSFVPPFAPYGGFTPFLDSLATHSLNWTHFLATSGRSFALQPSLFASLPYGERGFMELGESAPVHTSLIQILNENGYHTGYYSGYDASFDGLRTFLQRQGIDDLMDQHEFPEDLPMLGEAEGFSWGYSDRHTYRLAQERINRISPNTPRLDIYFTLELHEPFLIHDREEYQERVRDRLDVVDPPERERVIMEQYPEVFAAHLSTDDAIRELIEMYREREDYERTLFIITGDHRLIPVPHTTRIDRYYVPFMIYSPLVREAQQFHSVSSHLNVPETLLSHLGSRYALSTPAMVHWMAGPVDTSRDFRSVQSIPFIRNKNQMPDYLAGTRYLNGDQFFELREGMGLAPLEHPDIHQETVEEFDFFRRLNRYVTGRDRIMPENAEEAALAAQRREEAQLLEEHQLVDAPPNELFRASQEFAFQGQNEEAATLLRILLRMEPDHTDGRILYGRIYGWRGEYSSAGTQFLRALESAPDYYEVYSAMSDLYYWLGNPEHSVDWLERGLRFNEGHPELLVRLARAYHQQGNSKEAIHLLEKILESGNAPGMAADLYQQIAEQTAD